MVNRRTSIKWEGAELLDRTTSDLHVTLNSEGTLQLVNRMVLADEKGRCNGRDRERVSGRIQAKKIFEIDEPGDRGATLGLFVFCEDKEDDGTLHIAVNGHTMDLNVPPLKERSYWHRGWLPVDVPPGILVKGTNEVVLRASEGSTLCLLIENCVHPNRSAKSRDGGKTWDFGQLGFNNAYDGEYLVRLELNRYVPSGTVTSPVLNIGEAFAKKSFPSLPRLTGLSLRTKGDKPKKTRLWMECRVGSHPSPEDHRWSEWKSPSDIEKEDFSDARFVQWKAHLSTRDPNASPVLEKVSFSLKMEEDPKKDHHSFRTKNLGVEGPLPRSSCHFSYQRASDERSNILRERWALDKVISPATTQFEKFILLRQWVRNQWEDGWNMGPLKFVPPWDTLLILELTRRQLALGMCTHYATVMTQCCAALGLTARTIIIRNHCINEVWSDDFGKWVAMDAGGDVNDFRKTTYHLERDSVPLSALEIHRAWLDNEFDSVKFSPASASDAFQLQDRMKLFERFMIHLRNDELTSLEPGEPEHGKVPYQYDGYLHWADDKTEPLPWYSIYTLRESDLYWPVNQTKIHCVNAEKGNLTLALEHCTPNFSHFEISIDGDQWVRTEEEFDWTPGTGKHSIEARSVDLSGQRGIESGMTTNLT